MRTIIADSVGHTCPNIKQSNESPKNICYYIKRQFEVNVQGVRSDNVKVFATMSRKNSLNMKDSGMKHPVPIHPNKTDFLRERMEM